MKIILYDPLYSKVGHFERYSKYLAELLSGIADISEVIVVAEHPSLLELEKISNKIRVINHVSITAFDRNDSPGSKIKAFYRRFIEYKSYIRVFKIINNTEKDIVFFTSQGNLSFWLAVFKLKGKYMVSVISIKWLYFDKGIRAGLKAIFVYYLKKSALNLFTESMYEEVAQSEMKNTGNTLVMPDRYLYDKPYKANLIANVISLFTFGTIVGFKSPIMFLEKWITIPAHIRSKFNYEIRGKVKHADFLEKLNKYSSLDVNFKLYDEYLSDQDYDLLLSKSDFIVLPYPFEYTKHATSGVMWDCFENKKAIICPNIEPFIYYVKKYKIGYLYDIETFDKTLELIAQEIEDFTALLPARFEELHKDFSKNNLTIKLTASLYKMV